MRTRTVGALVAVVLLLAAAGAYGVVQERERGSLSEEWVSETARDTNVNHHVPAVGGTGAERMVFAPISGTGGNQCALVGLHAANGTTRWQSGIAPENCTSHSVANPGVVDVDGDGTAEVLAATTEQVVTAHEPATGEETFRTPLDSYGYTRPLTADFTGDGEREVVVVDVSGTVFALDSAGEPIWTERLSMYVWAQPAVEDFDGDGDPELAVAGQHGVVLLESDGTVAWRTDLDGRVGWMTTGAADDGSTALVVSTGDGGVVRLNGADGSTEWRRNVGAYAAVGAFDADAGRVHVTARDGVLRSLDAESGDTRWETTLTTASVQMMPPPRAADLDGDGSPELVVAGNGGTVSVVDPDSGEVLDAYARDVPIFAPPRLADVTGDGTADALVMYGDGRVVALTFE